jgi:hypothetical protein
MLNLSAATLLGGRKRLEAIARFGREHGTHLV